MATEQHDNKNGSNFSWFEAEGKTYPGDKAIFNYAPYDDGLDEPFVIGVSDHEQHALMRMSTEDAYKFLDWLSTMLQHHTSEDNI